MFPFLQTSYRKYRADYFWLHIETVFWLPVETVFWLPVELVFTILCCLAGGAFSFNFVVVSLGLPSLSWTFSVFYALISNRFSIGVCPFIPPTVLASETWPFPHSSSCTFYGGLSRVSLPLALSSASLCCLSLLLDEVSSLARIRISTSFEILWKIFLGERDNIGMEGIFY